MIIPILQMRKRRQREVRLLVPNKYTELLSATTQMGHMIGVGSARFDT